MMVQLHQLFQFIVLTICLISVQSQTNLEYDRQWVEEDVTQFCERVCNEECTACTAPKRCSEGQTKCGEEPPKEHPDCYPEDICVPKGCNCSYRHTML